MRKKMVLIGAGSAMFFKGFILDLIENPGDNKWHLALVDINPEVLKTIVKLCKKIIKYKNADIKLTYSTESCEVLPEADYVVSTIGVGGRRSWEKDVFIPRKYGINQPVGDTAMPGGISRAMRMIPQMIDITRDIMELCPNTIFFNYSNPMTAICRAVRKETGFPIIGLCIGVAHSENYIADFAGLEKESTSSFAIGINHLTFIYDYRYKGKNAWPIIEKQLDKVYKESCTDNNDNVIDWLNSGKEKVLKTLNEPFAWSLFKQYNAYPAPGDRHVTEFFPERFSNGQYFGKKLGIDAFSFENTIKNGDKIFDEIVNCAESTSNFAKEFFNSSQGEHEQLMEIINSIEKDERKSYSVNIPNDHIVENLPLNSVLEMPAITTSKGFCPIKTNDFPNELAGIISKHLAINEITVEAAIKGRKDLFKEAILMGGYMSNEKETDKMIEDLINAHLKYLPQFR